MPRFGKKSNKSKLTLPNLRLYLKSKKKSKKESNNIINNIVGPNTVSNNNSRVKVNELLNQYINELSDTNYMPSIHNEKKYRLLANNFNNKGHLRSPREDINYKIMEIVKKHNSDFAFPSTTVYLQKN